MKLSYKFFGVAYMTVLLSTGLGGICMINYINGTLWNTQIEHAKTAVNYAADCLLAFADVSYNEAVESLQKDIVLQMKETFGSTVTDIELYDSASADHEYTGLQDKEVVSRYVKKDGRLLMKSVCKLNTGTEGYDLVVYSDFTEVQTQCRLFWDSYRIVVFGISAISGFLLFAAANQLTKPLNVLAGAADEIAEGNYGNKVMISSSDDEITALSESFNAMSFAVEQKIKEIREETEKRDVFVADFTHELKTPMTAILGYAQLLRSYELDAFERKEAIEAIYNEAKRLEKLSLQLLDYCVFQKEEIELEPLNLLAMEDQLKATLKPLSEKYDVSCCVRFDDETVLANGVLFLSLLYNLADNALKASEPQTTVNIFSQSGKDEVRFFVEDKGRGIAGENIKFLTEPFYREDKSRSRKSGGAGLGLSLCKEITRLHGTELSFESEKGRGTTVSFTLKKGGEENE